MFFFGGFIKIHSSKLCLIWLMSTREGKFGFFYFIFHGFKMGDFSNNEVDI